MTTAAVTVIDLTGPIELEFAPTKQSDSVHRETVASTANALLLAYNGGPESIGVITLARALGCTIKRGTRQ